MQISINTEKNERLVNHLTIKIRALNLELKRKKNSHETCTEHFDGMQMKKKKKRKR